MKVNLGQIREVTARRIADLIGDLERAFEMVPTGRLQSYQVTIDFAAPGAVPGRTTQTVMIQGAQVGDVVLVSAPNAAPAGFMPPVGEVTAADTVKVHWLQFSGVAADPDGAGGLYTIDVWRH